MPHEQRGFTLVELLVVIAIIVILLALLVGGLEKALKASERAKCGANQRGVAQNLAAYALEYERSMPPPSNAAGAATASYDLRGSWSASGTGNTLPIGGTGSTAGVVGLGYLVANGRLPSTRLGEIANCPSLDTTSGTPVKIGMDEPLWVDNTTGQGGLAQTGTNNCAGGSFWTDQTAITNQYRIVGSYYYRGLSYALTHSNGTIRTNIAKQTFVLTSDFITHMPAAGADKYGRSYHHITGWNVSHGDGHVSYVLDDDGPLKDDGTEVTRGFVEGKVIGDNAAYPGPNGFPNDARYQEINGRAKPGADEAVFAYLGKR